MTTLITTALIVGRFASCADAIDVCGFAISRAAIFSSHRSRVHDGRVREEPAEGITLAPTGAVPARRADAARPAPGP
jgi:hypothetical protein